MEKTTHYQLNKPEVTDPMRLADFNANADIIDAALANKAEQSAVTTLSQTVSTLSAAVGTGGKNCRIATGSYVGTGTYGASNPTTVTFPFAPTWVMIAECGDGTATAPVRMNTSFLVNPLQGATSTYDKALRVTWLGNSVSWYCEDSVTNAHLAQNNRSGYVYYWVALCMG